VTLLRRLLKVQAGLWAAWGLLSLAVPGWLVGTMMGQPSLNDAVWIRTLGVMSIVLALIMVLVAQRIEDLWWWSWAFAVLEIGTATVFILEALVGVPAGAAAWPWWVLGIVNASFGAGLLVGMGMAGQEKPFV
jgi:hypothetical protein